MIKINLMQKKGSFYDEFRDRVRADQIREELKFCYNRRHCPTLHDCVVIVSQQATIRHLKKKLELVERINRRDFEKGGKHDV